MSRVVLITGASRGIGLALARKLRDAGHHVLLGVRNSKDLPEGFYPDQCILLDVRDFRGIADAVARIERDHGRLDGLINNAGLFVGHDPLSLPGKALTNMMRTNLLGPWALTLACRALLREAKDPLVLNVSSCTASLDLTAAKKPLPGKSEPRIAYCCVKAALNMLTLQLQSVFDLSPQDRHIRLVAVSPGFTATSMNNFKGDRTVEVAAETIAHLFSPEMQHCRGSFWGPDGPLPW